MVGYHFIVHHTQAMIPTELDSLTQSITADFEQYDAFVRHRDVKRRFQTGARW
jgi:hypothetical protein